jgi:aminoglycoside phosphotransferase (APT) family kinase protein
VSDAALLARLGFSSSGTVEKLSGGASNITLLVRDGERELIVRTPPPGAKHIKAGHDVIREARIIEKLAPVFPRVPRVHAIVEDESVIGVPFFAMERLAGVVLRSRVPKDTALSSTTMRSLSENFVDTLVALHAVDVTTPEWASVGRPEGYVQRQVDGWIERYEKSIVDENSDLVRVVAWLRDNVPAHLRGAAGVGRVAMVHNDFKYDNVVLDSADLSRIVGVLDWELSTVGDPMTDLGTVLAYWVEATDDEALRALPLCLTYLPGNLTRIEIVRRYEEKTGRPVDDLLFHAVLASFRVAIIAQQIYFRFAKGFTDDPRLAMMGLASAVVAARTVRVLDAGRIDVP